MSRTLLLLDDSRTMREVLKVYLMGRDYTFLEAADGERALEIMHAQDVDLVLADVNLPGIDGLAFLRQLRASSKATVRRARVVLISSDKTVASRSRTDVALADAFLMKPLQQRDLLRVLDGLLPATTP